MSLEKRLFPFKHRKSIYVGIFFYLTSMKTVKQKTRQKYVHILVNQMNICVIICVIVSGVTINFPEGPITESICSKVECEY